jgi:hypothetical protein
MTKFEYLVVEIPTTGLLGYKVDFEKLNSQLNEAGKQGWQLATNFKPSSPIRLKMHLLFYKEN